MSHLSISLLGSFQVHLAGQPVTGFSSNKVRALLAYLVVEAGQPHPRVQLSGLLWPDWPEQAARTYLRQSLANLRGILDDANAPVPFLLPDSQTLQFNRASKHWLDVTELTNALSVHATPTLPSTDPTRMAHLEETLTLYRGDFMDGFFLDGCPAYEEWQLLVREQRRRQVVEALHVLIGWCEQMHNYPKALAYAWRQAELEPLSEAAHRQLLRLLVRSGQRSAALERHTVFTHNLQEQLGVGPAPETVALYTQIRSGRLPDDELPPQSNPTLVTHPADAYDRRRHTLPAAPTPLVGREVETAALVDLLGQPAVHLVTLTGPAGVGKTRLALQVAEILNPSLADGVRFISLASIRDPELVIPNIALALDMPEMGSKPPVENKPLIESIEAYLQDRCTLLLLDNFEQVMAARSVISLLLMGCPALKILVVSREVLHLQAEHVYPVNPLALPPLQENTEPEDISTYAAVDLFIQRVQATRPDFALTQQNAGVVAELCVHLDGLPLAIELAAARSALLPTQALLDRLDNRFELLRGGARDAPARHQSLRRAIAWSYDLLIPDEQALFRRMAFFADGCSLEIVAALCILDGELDLDPLEGVASLLDKSLVRRYMREAPQGRQESCYVMLESIRDFGIEKLQVVGELALLSRRYA